MKSHSRAFVFLSLLILRFVPTDGAAATPPAEFEIPDDPEFLVLQFYSGPNAPIYWVHGDGMVHAVKWLEFEAPDAGSAHRISGEDLRELIESLLALGLADYDLGSVKGRLAQALNKEREETGLWTMETHPGSYSISIHLLNYRASPDDAPIMDFRTKINWVGNRISLESAAAKFPEITEIRDFLKAMEVIRSYVDKGRYKRQK